MSRQKQLQKYLHRQQAKVGAFLTWYGVSFFNTSKITQHNTLLSQDREGRNTRCYSITAINSLRIYNVGISRCK